MSAKLRRGKPVEVCRAGYFYDPRYGDFTISRESLARMVENFDAKTLGQEVFIDVDHKPGNGAAGVIRRLWLDGEVLKAEADWTPYGLVSIEEKGYAYLSAEYDESYQDNETRQEHGAVLKGAALTIRPVLKRLQKVSLTELQSFSARLTGTGAPDPAVQSLVSLYREAREAAELQPAEVRELESSLVALAESLPQEKRISLAELERQLAAREHRRQTDEAARARRFQGMRDGFRELVLTYGGSALTESDRSVVLRLSEQIKPEWPDDWVMRLAAVATKQLDELAINRQLAALGWRGGRPRRALG